MGYTNVKNPITIDESVTNWYTQTISRQASSLIPDDFEKLPAFETVKFSHRKSFSPTVDAYLPQDASDMVLTLGTFDAPYLELKPLVYIYVYGLKHHHIGYFYVDSDSSVHRMHQSSLKHVDIDEPFCDVGDHSVGEQTVYNRMRATALYFFLVAGHIEAIENYSHFWMDFSKACGWIANNGSRPKPHTKAQKQEPETVPVSAATPISGPEMAGLTHDTVASRKRTRDDGPMPTEARIKRRDYSHIVRIRDRLQNHPKLTFPSMHPSHSIIRRSLSPEHPVMAISAEARLANSERTNPPLRAEIDTQARAVEQLKAQMTVNHQLLAQVNGLTAEISRVKNESMFSQNAYRGIQVQYDELAERHANTLHNENALRDQLGQTQTRCAQAERRSKALEKEVEGLKQRMRRAGEALDISAL